MSLQYNNPLGGAVEYQEYRGVIMPLPFVKLVLKGRSLREHVEGIMNLTLRQDDIIVCAYPKCGTHWVWEIINVLITGAINKKPKESNMLDFVHAETIDELEASPRILNTHYAPHLLPAQIKLIKPKIVYIYRNPKDVAVSAYYHFSKSSKPLGIDLGSINDFIKSFPGTLFPYNYIRYLKEFDQFLRENPDIPVITLTYEDLTYNPEANVRKLAEFIGVDVTDEQIRHTIETCSFDNMKKADEEFKEKFILEKKRDESHIYRKGKVGDWKNHFTVADSNRYDDILEKELADIDVNFTYT